MNQPYMKYLAYLNTGVELKASRSLVRLKEIKKAIQEQRLAFLQSQLKDLEDALN